MIRLAGWPASLCALLAALAASAPVSAAPTNRLAELVPQERHARLAKQVYKAVSRQHYLELDIDDSLSERMFDSYLDALDSNRMYLLSEDVSEFGRYRHALDNGVRTGRLEPAYAIFNRYRKRFLERTDWALDQVFEILKAGFDARESVRVERKGAAWPQSADEADATWRKRLKLQILNLRLAGKSDADSVDVLERRLNNQKRRMTQTNSEDVFRVYSNAWIRVYDPHTSYFSEHSSKNFQINMSLSLEGIGAVLEQDDEYIKIVRLIHAGPADKQGELKPADRIVAVGQGADGEMLDVVGWRLDEVVDKIRGPRGTVVRLDVLPVDSLNDGDSKLIAITRDTVRLEEQAASKEVLELEAGGAGPPHRFGVIDLPTFYTDFAAMQRGDKEYRSTTRDARRLLDELIDADVDGVVIDLRGNGGGSLAEANDLIGLFIRSGPTVQIRHKNNRVTRQGKRRATPYYDGPLAVVIDRLSASASEIFAGAIQDYRRGLVMGSVSFGKGTVQTLLQLRPGQMKITEAKFYRISGDSTQHRGIIPDFMFPAVYDSREIGESALEYALPWDQIPGVRYLRYHDFDTQLLALLSAHQERALNTPGLVYLEKRLALERERADVEVVSLHEESRRAQQARRKAEDRALENEWRVASGLEPLAESVAGKDKGEGEAEDAAEAEAKSARSRPNEEDHALLEVAKILRDAMPLFGARTALR